MYNIILMWAFNNFTQAKARDLYSAWSLWTNKHFVGLRAWCHNILSMSVYKSMAANSFSFPGNQSVLLSCVMSCNSQYSFHLLQSHTFKGLPTLPGSHVHFRVFFIWYINSLTYHPFKLIRYCHPDCGPTHINTLHYLGNYLQWPFEISSI